MTPLTTHRIARQVEILSSYAEKGDCENYWITLVRQGVKYAKLALAVVRNDTLSGVIANGYARMRAKEMNLSLSEQDWKDLAKTLIKNDFAYRKAYAKNMSTYAQVFELPIKDIADYHTTTFMLYGLDEYAWTAHIPLAPFLEKADFAAAELLWKSMLDVHCYASATGTGWSEASAIYNGPHSKEHAIWLAKVGLLATDYLAMPKE